MDFGDILRRLIEDHDMTQRQLAAILNIAPSTVGNYIQKSREPDFSTLKRIADIFHVSIDYLLDHRSFSTESRGEDEMIQVYRSLTAEQQQIYLEQGKAFLFHKKENANTGHAEAK